MRDHRNVSQESQHRRLLLQRIADRKQAGRRVLLESDSDQSDSAASTSSAHSDPRPPLADPASDVQRSPRNTFKRLSQIRPHQHSQSENVRRENLPGAAEIAACQHTPPATASRKSTPPMANPEELLNSFSSLSVSKPARRPVAMDNSFAAAIITQLPDEQPAGSSRGHGAAEVIPKAHPTNSAVAGTEAITEFKMKPDVEKRLYRHQLEGVKWLWSLHKLRRGGILGKKIAWVGYCNDLN